MQIGGGRFTLGIREKVTGYSGSGTRSPAVEVVWPITAHPDIHPQDQRPCAPPYYLCRMIRQVGC